MLKSYPFHILNQTCFKGRGVIYPSTPRDSPFGEASWRPLKCVSPTKKIGIHEGVYVFYRVFWSTWYNLHWSLVSQLGSSCSQVPPPTAGAATAGQWGVQRGDGRCGGVPFLDFLEGYILENQRLEPKNWWLGSMFLLFQRHISKFQVLGFRGCSNFECLMRL